MISKVISMNQVFSGFCLMFNSWGLINAFGVFQEYYSSFDPPLATPSSISWIGSLQTFLLLLCGSMSGGFVDQGFAQGMAVLGTVLVTLSMILTSFSGEFISAKQPVYYQVLLSQGILSGLGMSMLLVPSTAIIPTYFIQHRSLAVGLANTGASIGGIIYPILTRRLLHDVGFSWAMRATALVVIVTAGIGSMLVHQRPELTRDPKKRVLYDLRCFKETPYILFVCGVFFAFAGSYIPYFYITTWVRDLGFSLQGLEPYHLLSILNAGGLFGRIIPSHLADAFALSPILVQSFAAIVCGILVVGWTYIKNSLPALVLWAVLYGFFSGSIISLIPAAAATLTQDMSRLGGRLGVVFAANAAASLVGNPVAGAILQNTSRGWRNLAIYCAVLNLTGGCLLAICGVLKRRQ